MSKIFLSHSSKDKDLVRKVYNTLGPNVCEMDEFTFEGGLPNVEVINRALDRCDIFVLFNPNKSDYTKWVNLEVNEAKKRINNKKLFKILIFDIHGNGHKSAPTQLNDYSVFNYYTKHAQISNAISRAYVELQTAISEQKKPYNSFAGRDEEIASLKRGIMDIEAEYSVVNISGRPMMGKFAMVRRAIQDLRPNTFLPKNPIFVDERDSLLEVAIKILRSFDEQIDLIDLEEARAIFSKPDRKEQVDYFFKFLKKYLTPNQIYILEDSGGILNSEGSFNEFFKDIVFHNNFSFVNQLYILTKRRVYYKQQLEASKVFFYNLGPMSEDASRQFITIRAMELNLKLTNAQILYIVELCQGVPKSIEYLLQKAKLIGVELSLKDISDIVDRNFQQSLNFINSLKLDDNANEILKVLRLYPTLPAEFMPRIFDFNLELFSAALSSLIDWNVVYQDNGVYFICPTLTSAIDRGRQYDLPVERQRDYAKKIIELIGEYSEEQTIPSSLIETGGIAYIESESDINWVRQFVLPSNYVYLAKKTYDSNNFRKALQYSREALNNISSLSPNGKIMCIRYLGLSAARLASQNDFNKAIMELNKINDDYSKGLALFLNGFKSRLNNELSVALDFYTKARKYLNNDFSLAREISLVALRQYNFPLALENGFEALKLAPDNPYIIEIVIRAKIGSTNEVQGLAYDKDFNSLFSRLEKSSEVYGLGLYQIRRAEYLLKSGVNDEALKHANEAVKKFPHIADAYLTRSRIHLKRGDYARARSDFDTCNKMGQRDISQIEHLDIEICLVEMELKNKNDDFNGIMVNLQHLEMTNFCDYNHYFNIYKSKYLASSCKKSPILDEFFSLK